VFHTERPAKMMGGFIPVYLIAIALVGVCLGVLTASTRVPRIRVVPFIGSLVIVVAAVIVSLQFEATSLLGGIVFAASVLISSSVYAGVLWKREDLEPGLTVWDWMLRDFTHPRYVRELYLEAHSAPQVDEHHAAERV
jgi:hypothetical protein